jgi:hypothetical protein
VNVLSRKAPVHIAREIFGYSDKHSGVRLVAETANHFEENLQSPTSSPKHYSKYVETPIKAFIAKKLP